jgi:hypothetical protein
MAVSVAPGREFLKQAAAIAIETDTPSNRNASAATAMPIPSHRPVGG